MIFARRAATVPLLLVLTLVLAVTLIAQRVNATVLSPSFHQEQLSAIGAYDAVHDEVLPRALDDFLDTQDEQVPDNLEGIALPTDAASRAAILEFGRTALPPAYLEAESNAVIETLVAYLRGDGDDLALTVSLNEPLRAAFLDESFGATSFERTWGELGLGEIAIAGLSRNVEVPELDTLRNPQSLLVLARLRAGGMALEDAATLVATIYEVAPDPEVADLTSAALEGNATIEELENLKTLLVTTRFIPAEPAQALVDAVAIGTSPDDDLLTVLLGDERDEAVRWFEGEVFGAVGELGSYLAGDTEHFAIQIEFDQYPELALVLAGALNSDPRTLLRDGFRLNDVDIQRELDAGDDPPVESLATARTIFTAAGRTFGVDDLNRDAGPNVTDGGGGLNLERIRSVVAPTARWAIPVGATITVWLAVAIGFLGGRSWWSRGVWAAAAVAAPAILIAILAGPIFGATIGPRLSDSLAETRSDLVADDVSWTPLGLRALDQIEVVAYQQANAMVTTALLIAFVATVLGAAIVAWRWYSHRETSGGTQTDVFDGAGSNDGTEQLGRVA